MNPTFLPGSFPLATFQETFDHLVAMNYLLIDAPEDLQLVPPLEKLLAPLPRREDLHGTISAWMEFQAAWNGVLCAFSTAVNHANALEHMLQEPSGPCQSYFQDREMVGFFIHGLATIESFCYGMYALGHLHAGYVLALDPEKEQRFALSNLRQIKPHAAVREYQKFFQHQSITASLVRLIGIPKDTSNKPDPAYETWLRVRNVLVHRGWPARIQLQTGYCWILEPEHTLPITQAEIHSKWLWLVQSLTILLETAETFVKDHFSYRH